MREEHYDCAFVPREASGPSPRARGAPGTVHSIQGGTGTIPACAGSTSFSRPKPPSPGGPSPCARRARPRTEGPGTHQGTIPAWGARRPGRVTESGLGPSPRARGAQKPVRRDSPPPGTIPACAGSTAQSWCASARTWDHPRVRGEHVSTSGPRTRDPGPSPRARGAHLPHQRQPREEGTIPACAGSTDWCTSIHVTGRDHPRVRGEHSSIVVQLDPGWGPSPRARGAHAQPVLRPVAPGTIPACAGSTKEVLNEHPDLLGPSPRARGALDLPQARGPDAGTIPACAGSTPSRSRGPRCPRDHPRVRGEHEDGLLAIREERGPSPRARGAQRVRRPAERQRGTIPACAGSTRLHLNVCGASRDHPRVRGEHRPVVLPCRARPGPSPRARGARLVVLQGDERAGTIPACAGSTTRWATCPGPRRDHPRVRGEHMP